MDDRKQINIRVDQEFLDAVDDIRAMTRPVPNLSEAIRDAVIETRNRLKRKIEKQEGHEKRQHS